MSRWVPRQPEQDDGPTVERVALRYGIGGVAAIFAVAGGLALASAWSDARDKRRSR